VRVLSAIILAALLFLAVFAALNWGALTAPTALSFAVFSVNAPLGVILLGFAMLFAAVVLAYAAMQRTAMLIESRRHAQELRAQREIAESAEASRLHELKLQLERECGELRSSIRESTERQAAATNGLEDALRRALEESANGLAAAVGQVDDKLNRLR